MKYLIILLMLTACTQFSIENESFEQEQMAHTGNIGSMYLTSATQDSDHNCDDVPSNCCASGYHMCTAHELIDGSRRIEYSGTGRDTDPFGTADVGQVVTGYGFSNFNVVGADCAGYSTNGAGTTYFTYCQIIEQGATTGTVTCSVTSACSALVPQWCCSN